MTTLNVTETAMTALDSGRFVVALVRSALDGEAGFDTTIAQASVFEANGAFSNLRFPAVANATRPDETVVAGTVADIATKVEADAPEGPVLVMIGKVLGEVADTQALVIAPSPLVGEGIPDVLAHSVG